MRLRCIQACSPVACRDRRFVRHRGIQHRGVRCALVHATQSTTAVLTVQSARGCKKLQSSLRSRTLDAANTVPSVP
eukprot:6173524-Pleurochrysis_carterae.AAC.1